MPGPFERYAREAPSLEMRELARVAASRNLSQEQLAREFANAADGRVINGGNVARHFASKTPQRQTVEIYRTILGVHREHLRLVDGAPLTELEMRSWRAYFEGALGLRIPSKAARAAALDALDSLPDSDREKALHEFALAERRDQIGAPDLGDGGLSPALAAIARHLTPKVDLAAGVRRPDQRADFLVSLWSRCRSVNLSEAHVDALLTIARSFAIEDGLDATIMDERLADARSKRGGSYFQARHRLSSSEPVSQKLSKGGSHED